VYQEGDLAVLLAARMLSKIATGFSLLELLMKFQDFCPSSAYDFEKRIKKFSKKLL